MADGTHGSSMRRRMHAPVPHETPRPKLTPDRLSLRIGHRAQAGTRVRRAGNAPVGTWWFRGANLVLAGLLVCFGWSIWDDLTAPRPAVPEASSLQPDTVIDPQAARTGSPRLDAYGVIWERNLFAGSRPGGEWNPGRMHLHAIPLAGRGQDVRLIGTAVSARPGSTYAVIDSAGGNGQGIYRTRDRVGAVTIVAVLRNHVVIETDAGERLRLSVDEAPAVDGKRRAGAVVPAFASAAALLQPPDSQDHISLSEVAASFSNPERIIRETVISPHLNAGISDGFYLGRLRAADVLYRMGLRTGDVIKGVDGEVFAGPQDAGRFLARLTQGGAVSLALERRGRDRNLVVVIDR